MRQNWEDDMSGNAPFTDFSSVTPNTNIESLNLSWRECDLPERERTKDVHRLHPYLGKFVPQLVEIFLRKYEPRLVVDPFVGSGTTLVEASRMGIDSFGIDIHPFNCLLCKVKTDTYDLDRLEREAADILKRSEVSQHHLTPTDYLSTWFAPRALDELLAYCSLIPEYYYSDVLKVILARSARSARLIPHYKLDYADAPQITPYWCRKHKRMCKPTQEARKFLQRYSADTIRRIREFAQTRKPACASVVCADSGTVHFPPSDLLITSPPYVGLIDYREQHRYAYELLSLLPDPFASIGYRATDDSHDEAREIGAPGKGTSKQARHEYQKGIVGVLSRAIEPMPVGSIIVVVVSDRYDMYRAIRERLQVEEVCALNRRVNRRTGCRSGAFYEQVLVWRKVMVS